MKQLIIRTRELQAWAVEFLAHFPTGYPVGELELNIELLLIREIDMMNKGQ